MRYFIRSCRFTRPLVGLLLFCCRPQIVDIDTRAYLDAFGVPAQPLGVDSFEWQLAKDGRRPVLMHFTEPMVGYPQLGEESVDSFVAINPDVVGMWQWLDPHTLRFTPVSPWDKSPQYVFSVPAGTESLLGNALLKPLSFDLAAEKMIFTVKPPGDSVVAPDATWKILLRPPVRAPAKNITATLQSTDGTQNFAIDLTCTQPVTQTGACSEVRVKPRELLPSDQTFDLRLDVKADPGQQTNAAKAQWQYRSAEKFVMNSITAPPFSHKVQTLAIRTSTPVDSQDFLKYVSVSPVPGSDPEPVAVWSDEKQWMEYTLPLAASTHYTLQGGSELTDIYGQLLTGESRLEFDTGPFEKKMVLPAELSATVTGDDQKVGFSVSGLSRVTVRLSRITHVKDALTLLADLAAGTVTVPNIKKWDEERSWDFPLDGETHAVEFSFSALKNAEQPGLWLIAYDAEAAPHLASVRLRQNTDLHLHVVRDADVIKVTGTQAGARVTVYDERTKLLRTGITKADGQWLMQGSVLPKGVLFISVEKRGDVVLQSLPPLAEVLPNPDTVVSHTLRQSLHPVLSAPQENPQISLMAPKWIHRGDKFTALIGVKNNKAIAISGQLGLYIGGRDEPLQPLQSVTIPSATKTDFSFRIGENQTSGLWDNTVPVLDRLSLVAHFSESVENVLLTRHEVTVLDDRSVSGWLSLSEEQGGYERTDVMEMNRGEAEGFYSLRVGLGNEAALIDLSQLLIQQDSIGVSGLVSSTYPLLVMNEFGRLATGIWREEAARSQRLALAIEILTAALGAEHLEMDSEEPWGLADLGLVVLADWLKLAKTEGLAVSVPWQSLMSWAEGKAVVATSGSLQSRRQALSARVLAVYVLHRLGYAHPEWLAAIRLDASLLNPEDQARLAEMVATSDTASELSEQWVQWLEVALLDGNRPTALTGNLSTTAQMAVTLARLKPTSKALKQLRTVLLGQDISLSGKGHGVPLAMFWALSHMPRQLNSASQPVKLDVTINKTPVMTAILTADNPSEVLILPLAKLPRRLHMSVMADTDDQSYTVSTHYRRILSTANKRPPINNQGVTLTRLFINTAGQHASHYTTGSSGMMHVGIYAWKALTAADLILPLCGGCQLGNIVSTDGFISKNFGDRLMIGWENLATGWHEIQVPLLATHPGEFTVPGASIVLRSDESVVGRTQTQEIIIEGQGNTPKSSLDSEQ